MATADIQTKSTKDRLEELKELYNGGYVTESEFKIARVNILKDGGIDVVTQLQHARRPYLQQGEEESKGCGCGCFMATLLLTAVLVLSAAFFAAPYWPDSFGGVRARATREWFTAKSMEFIGKFFKDSDDEVPDPVSSNDWRPSVESSGVAEPDVGAEPDLTDAVDEPVTLPPEEPSTVRSENVSLDIHTPPQPSASADLITASANAPAVGAGAAEIQTTVSEGPISSDLRSENTIRGSVTSPNVRIRSAPDTSTNDNIVGRARAGDRFTVLEEGTDKDGSKWYNVVYENEDKRGWISGSLVKLER